MVDLESIQVKFYEARIYLSTLIEERIQHDKDGGKKYDKQWIIDALRTVLFSLKRQIQYGLNNQDTQDLYYKAIELLPVDYTTVVVLDPEVRFPAGVMIVTTGVQGPKGEKGDTGEKGDPGNQGPPGRDGGLPMVEIFDYTGGPQEWALQEVPYHVSVVMRNGKGQRPLVDWDIVVTGDIAKLVIKAPNVLEIGYDEIIISYFYNAQGLPVNIISDTLISTRLAYSNKKVNSLFDGMLSVIPTEEDIRGVVDEQIIELNNAVQNLSADNIIDPSEKIQLKRELTNIQSQNASFIEQINIYDIAVEGDNYILRYNQLVVYLTDILSNMTTNTEIVPVDFQAIFNNFYQARAALMLVVATIVDENNKQAQSTAEGVKNLTDFWKLTLDPTHGLIAAGTILFGTATQNNGGMTGVTNEIEPEKSVRFWQGAPYSARDTATWRVHANGDQWTGSLANGWDWNITNEGALTIRGAIIQDPGGNTAVMTVDRGTYDPTTTYYKGNIVRYNGSLFYYKATAPGNIIPGENANWTTYVAKGDTGSNGLDGSDGLDGAPGTSSYFHIAFAESPDGTVGFNQVDGTYIGTYVDSIQADSVNPASYVWRVFKGANGEQGIPGVDGSNGQTSYLHLKYSDDNGVTFTANNGETVGKYLGQYVDFIELDSSNPASYTWALIKGADGPQGETGIQGPPGANGVSTYFHVAYANSADGTVGFNQSGGSYIGTYVDTIAADSSNPASYTWRLFKGADGANGEQGIPGTNGADGQTSYLHIKYSNDGGSTFTASNGEAPGTHIGQYVDFILADSSNPASYTWSLIKGADGATGAPGADGKFTEFRFAKNGSTTVAPGLTVGDPNPTGWTTATPSLDPLEYLWMTSAIKNPDGSLVASWNTPVRTKGADGANGNNGADGATGATGPFILGRGAYDAIKQYYGLSTRVEVVKYNNVWYVTRMDAGAIPVGTLPTNATYWNAFGGQFESVATDLLFASMAYIDNLGVKTLRTGTSGRRIAINENGDNSFKAYHTNGVMGIQIGTDSNGLAVMTAYDSGGNKVWDLNQTGIVYVNSTPESWSAGTPYRNTNITSNPLTQTDIDSIHANLRENWTCYGSNPEGPFGATDDVGVVRNLKGYLYQTGINADQSTNAQYQGWHTDPTKSTSNFLHGWYVEAGYGYDVMSSEQRTLNGSSYTSYYKHFVLTRFENGLLMETREETVYDLSIGTMTSCPVDFNA